MKDLITYENIPEGYDFTRYSVPRNRDFPSDPNTGKNLEYMFTVWKKDLVQKVNDMYLCEIVAKAHRRLNGVPDLSRFLTYNTLLKIRSVEAADDGRPVLMSAHIWKPDSMEVRYHDYTDMVFRFNVIIIGEKVNISGHENTVDLAEFIRYLPAKLRGDKYENPDRVRRITFPNNEMY